MRATIGIIALLLIVIVGGYTYWNFMRVYDDGVREGIVQKFSRKGDIFKTYEGELLGGGFGRVGTGFQAQYFYFSVEDPQIAAYIEQNAGRNMRLHFVKYKKSLPWRGENYNSKNQESGQYVVDKAEVVPTQQLQNMAPQNTNSEPVADPIPY